MYTGIWYIKFLVLINDAIKRNLHEINKLIKCNGLEMKARIDATVSHHEFKVYIGTYIGTGIADKHKELMFGHLRMQ